MKTEVVQPHIIYKPVPVFFVIGPFVTPRGTVEIKSEMFFPAQKICTMTVKVRVTLIGTPIQALKRNH